jgi:ATP-dependent Clp protease ATP-binding subunit ClpA
MLRIAEILLAETADNLTRQRVTITFDGDVPGWLLAQCGVDPQAGARPLRRLVKLWVEDAVADYLILNRHGDEVTLNLVLRGGQPVVEAIDVVHHGEGRR